MSKIQCVPIYLFPEERIQFKQCTVVPGLSIKKYKGPIAEKITSFQRKLPKPLNFHPLYFVCIEEDVYLENLKIRLEKEDVKLPKNTFIDVNSLAKQAIMSVILAGRVSFKTGGAFTLTKIGQQYHTTGFANIENYETAPISMEALYENTGSLSSISTKKISLYGKLLDRYYRSGVWWIDRYAMALGHFWGALCAKFRDQAFLGIISTLECLLSTKNLEITHTLCERAAFILHKEPDDRIEAYKHLKKIYNVRSQLVHGKAYAKKGTQHNNSLYVSAKGINVPSDKLEQACNTTLCTLIAVINNKQLLSLMQTKKSEDKITKDLENYFIRDLFNSS